MGRVFVTGGAGFIGSHIVDRVAESRLVTAFDSFRRVARRLPDAPPEKVSIIRGDVLDRESLVEAMRGHDQCLHLAAIAGTTSVRRDSAMTSRVNVLGTLNCLEAAIESGVRRVVVFSTSEVYGRHAVDVSEDQPASIPPADEDDRWAYAASKLAAEHVAMGLHRAGRIETVVLRPFNVYGPRQVGEGAILDMLTAALGGGPIIVRGDGSQTRSWCYVSDLVDAAMAALSEPDAAGQLFNVGNPAATVDNVTLAETVSRIVGGCPIERRPAVGPDVQDRKPSIDRARRFLRFEPTIGLEEGIARTLAWMRSARER